MNGFLNIDKPAGWTSHDVVAKIRRLLGAEKVGHTGTLDPAATGVLPVCVGKATKVAQFLLETDKQYRVVMRLGEATDTQDATGTILSQKPVSDLTHHQIRKEMESFRGPIMQLVPMYSAVKVGGQPLYKAARQRKVVERPSRQVIIYHLDLLDIEENREKSVIDVTFDVSSSKGTYIRTLCADIGDRLGSGGHLLKLRRLASGPFHVDDSRKIGEIQDRVTSGTIHEVLISIQDALSNYASLRVTPKASNRVIHGGNIWGHELENVPTRFRTGEILLVYNALDELVALASALMSSDRMTDTKKTGTLFKVDKVLV